MELAIIGSSEFVMGFELIGIRTTLKGESEIEITKCFEEAMSREDIGIIVTDQRSVDALEPFFQRKVLDSPHPVVVVLSTESGAQDNLRDLIKKTIGIDLMGDQDGKR